MLERYKGCEQNKGCADNPEDHNSKDFGIQKQFSTSSPESLTESKVFFN
jgi:hypothetical protein